MGARRIFKYILVNGKRVNAFVDTGCDITLIGVNCFNEIIGREYCKSNTPLHGVGGGKVFTKGHICLNIWGDGVRFEMCVHVVNDADSLFPFVLGNDIFEFIDIQTRGDKVTFVEKSSLSHNSSDANEIYQLNVIENPVITELQSEFESLCNLGCFEESFVDELDLCHLKNPEKVEILQIVSGYKPRKINESPIEMKLILSDESPVYEGPRRLPYADQEIVEKQVQEWLSEGIIKESTSNYASPVVLASKKDGNKRLCCDYRRLNKKIIRDNFPMAVIDDVLAKLQKAKVYTTLDLRNGFFHVPVAEDSRKYTSFVTQNGQYEFLFVPFGISNSPAVFCRYVHSIFRQLIQNGTIVAYMDDIIIPSETIEEGLQKLKEVLELAQSYGLQIKWQKSQFLKTRVTFLGYILENGTIKPSEEKLKAVKNYPLPSDKKSIQRFLGLASYFRRFIPNFTLIAKPLSDCLRKDNIFKITDEMIAAFEQLKFLLVSAPVLTLFNPQAYTEVHCDASMFGYGAVLMQRNSEDQQLHPIEYMSRKTTPAEQKYHSYELEVLAVVSALKKWRVYILGCKFKIVTDCKAFSMTMNKNDVPPRIARWAMFLQEFDYHIEHRAGTKLKHADALSRVYCLMVESSLRHRIKEAQMRDSWIKAVRQALMAGEYEDFYIHGDILLKDPNKELLVVPCEMEKEIIEMAHRQGHFGSKKTLDILKKQFFIPDALNKVANVVKSCVECLVSDTKTGKKEGFLNSIDKGDKPLTTYHLDHIGPMTDTRKQYNHILVVVDAFSKFVWLYPTKSTGSKEVLNKLEKQASVFGNPKRIITDRGTAFSSNAFEDYCTRENIQHLMIATGVPRGNGQVVTGLNLSTEFNSL